MDTHLTKGPAMDLDLKFYAFDAFQNSRFLFLELLAEMLWLFLQGIGIKQKRRKTESRRKNRNKSKNNS